MSPLGMARRLTWSAGETACWLIACVWCVAPPWPNETGGTDA